MPMLSYSSSVTAAMMICRVAGSPTSRERERCAAHIAAMPDFMSRRSASINAAVCDISASNGECVIPSTPTVSRCPANMSAGEFERADARDDIGPAGVCVAQLDGKSPIVENAAREKERHRASPGAPGTSVGFRESISVSARVSATASPRGTPMDLRPSLAASAVTGGLFWRRPSLLSQQLSSARAFFAAGFLATGFCRSFLGGWLRRGLFRCGLRWCVRFRSSCVRFRNRCVRGA